MYLTRAEITGAAPLDEMTLLFLGSDGQPRPITVVYGGGGVGKTALLQIIANTRPGNTMALVGRTRSGATEPAHATCEWLLGEEDPARPHPLVVSTPSALSRRDDDVARIEKRERSLYEGHARQGRGFVFVSLSSVRWFSRQAVSLNAPLRTVAHYDVRSTAAFDDATNSDLTRATKQSLAYAAIASALAPQTQKERNRLREESPRPWDTRVLGSAMLESVNALVGLAGYRYDGLDPTSLEPQFCGPGDHILTFDRLPRGVRDLTAMAALTLRALWAAHPEKDPRTVEGVVAIDELDRDLDDASRENLLPAMRLAFPRVQWIVTTTSSIVAGSVDAESVFAFRRLPKNDRVQLYTGQEARVH